MMQKTTIVAASAGVCGMTMYLLLLRNEKSLSLRLRTWLRLMKEYGQLRSVYSAHLLEGFFDYGKPCGRFEDLTSHPAFKELEALRAVKSENKVSFVADFSVLPTYLPIEEGAAACLGALGLAAADLLEARGGPSQVVTVKQSDAGLSTAGYMFLKVKKEGTLYKGCDGFQLTIAQEGTVNPTRRAYKCGDGHFLFFHGGFPKLKQGLLDFLRCGATVEDISKATAAYEKSDDLEASMRAKGLAVTKCRTPKEWRASEQGKAVAQLPPICFKNVLNKKEESPPVRLLKPGIRPLSDVIVVDFSHVIASPMVGRTLAEHGATVFKVFTSKRPRRKLFDEETNNGKVPLNLDLDIQEDIERLWDLLKVADVLIDGYTAGVLSAKGFDTNSLNARCPHLVYLRVSCYGHVGPWAKHKGFQQNANFATGIATIDDEALLCYQLTSQVDYTTGFLGAMGVIVALTKRQLNETNGLTVVNTSLCQAATWMARFGARMPSRLDFYQRVSRLIWGLDYMMITDGNLQYLPPALSMSHSPPARVTGFQRWWNDN